MNLIANNYLCSTYLNSTSIFDTFQWFWPCQWCLRSVADIKPWNYWLPSGCNKLHCFFLQNTFVFASYHYLLKAVDVSMCAIKNFLSIVLSMGRRSDKPDHGYGYILKAFISFKLLCFFLLRLYACLFDTFLFCFSGSI